MGKSHTALDYGSIAVEFGDEHGEIADRLQIEVDCDALDPRLLSAKVVKTQDVVERVADAACDDEIAHEDSKILLHLLGLLLGECKEVVVAEKFPEGTAMEVSAARALTVLGQRFVVLIVGMLVLHDFDALVSHRRLINHLGHV